MRYVDAAKNFAMIGGTGARPVGPTSRDLRLANSWELSTIFLGSGLARIGAEKVQQPSTAWS